MAILTRADLANAMAGGQQILFAKTSTGAQTITAAWGSSFAGSGTYTGTLAGTSTAAGVVPTDATSGCPPIRDFAGGAVGYLGQVTLTPTPTASAHNGQRFRLSDMLWKGGAYPFNAAQTLSAQPSYSSRIPGGDYKGTEIWFEGVTTFTGNPTITVTYTNQDGTTGQSTSISPGRAPVVNNHIQFPLSAGDTGVQKIESVTCTVATVGTFNILVLRPLWCGHIIAWGDAGATGSVNHGPDLTDLPILFGDSALIVQHMNCLGNTMGAFDAIFTIISG